LSISYCMENNQPEDITASPAVLEMLTVANEYCLFYEKADAYPMQDILDYFQKIAPLIYLKGSLLPGMQEEDPGPGERFVTEEQWESIFKVLRDKFGKNDIYYTHDHNHDSVESSLSDNMADIYQDMKDFVMLYQKNTLVARQQAIILIRGLFRSRWGPALLNGLAAVHQILFHEDISPDLLSDDDQWLA